MDETINESFRHIRSLAKDIEGKLNGTSASDQRLLNEIAGMFAVTIAASYEGIVKETLVDYASKFHERYKFYIQKDFERLNARISVEDLKSYSRRFGLAEWTGKGAKRNSTIFHMMLQERQLKVEKRYRTDLLRSYENIFLWRNAYAHERTTNATFSDVYNSHRVAQHVIRCFADAFKVG
ncbi:HEPN domain-containing protein [Allorhizobium pseudoryzae]|uniref:HEPN domain-containing protein n=1 Tax=Allorhizobium pseudoryzae TaxID=379684 RepID=UPI003D02D6E0